MKTSHTILLLLGILSLFILASCTTRECTTNTDCTKPHYTGTCQAGTCAYTPLPNECGNDNCDTTENQCTCPADCGPCTETQGTYLTKTCIANECLFDIPPTSTKPVFLSNEQTSQGDKLRISLTHNQPFNLNKHTANIHLSIAQENTHNTNRRIKTITLTALTPTKQIIVLAEKNLNKPLWPGYDIQENLPLTLPDATTEGEVNNLALTITYDYLSEQAGRQQQKTTTITTKYNTKLTYVQSPNTYPCPNCNDNNPATTDDCTNGFCTHTPLPNTCGNDNCDTTENQCTCPADCGPCTGTEQYTTKTCHNNQCISQQKSGIIREPLTIFEDRNLNIFTLQNYYKYTQPFSTSQDTFTLDTTLTRTNPSITNINIEAVRLLDGNNEIASNIGNKALPTQGSKQTITITIPPQTKPETERTLTLAVWYTYDQNGQQHGRYTKPLGKIVLLTT